MALINSKKYAEEHALDLLTVIEHESRFFIWNNKIICIFALNI